MCLFVVPLVSAFRGRGFVNGLCCSGTCSGHGNLLVIPDSGRRARAVDTAVGIQAFMVILAFHSLPFGSCTGVCGGYFAVNTSSTTIAAA